MAKCPKCGLDFAENYRKCPNCQSVISPRKKEVDFELPKLKSEKKEIVIKEEVTPKVEEVKKVEIKKEEVKKEKKSEVKVKPIPLKVKKATSHKEKNKDKDVKKAPKKKVVTKVKKEKNIKLVSSLKIGAVTMLLILNVALITNIVMQIEDQAPKGLENFGEPVVKPILENVSILGSWLTQNNGLFVFQDDYKFYWYDNYQVQDNNYYGGSYSYKQGLDALIDMGYTEEEFYKEFDSKEKIDLENVYSIELVPTLSYRNSKDITITDLNKGEKWWFLLVINKDNTAIGYNKTRDLRYSLEKNG